ncbi:MAG: PAS domain-containing sensor histidine kinase [Chloroflexota bacterium]
MPFELSELAGERLGLVILVTASVAAGWLTLNLDGRPNVSLLALTAALAWWQLGWQTGVVCAVFAALGGSALRRAHPLDGLLGGARVGVATLAASASASLIPGMPATVGDAFPAAASTALAGVTLIEVARIAVWLLVASGLDWALDWGHQQLASRRRAMIERLTRLDVPFVLVLFPLALLFHGTYRVLGWEAQGVLLGGLFAALLVARTYINLRALHAALERVYAVVEEQRERLDTLVTHSGEAIFTVDADLRLGTANRALEQLLGRPAEEIEGRLCAEVCHFEDEHGARLCPERCPLVTAQREAKPLSVDVVYQEPEKPPKHVLLTYAAVSDPGGPLRLGIGIARDITAQREAERLREEFVSLVTHELRSPLTSSTGYLDLLKRTIERAPISVGLDTGKALGYVDRIQGAESHLLRLVNNLLDIARIERTDLPLDLGEVRLGRLVSEVLEGVAIQASQKQIGLKREGEHDLPPCWTSELYVREILGNLVSNGIKYTPDGGTVTVRLGRLLEPTTISPGGSVERAEIAVTDTGYGMSPADLGRLFGKFFRSGRPEIRKERGTGLGLALSKQMALRLDGDITVTSAIGEGSTFTLTLPMTPVPSAADIPDRVAV